VATVPTTLVFVTGQVVTAAQLNGDVGGTWGPFVLSPPWCQVRQTVAQNIATSAWTGLLFDTEDDDQDLWHSLAANTDRIVPQTPGWVRLEGGASFATNATGFRGTRWALNGTAIAGSQEIVPAATGGATVVGARSVAVQVNGTTDIITLQVFQSSGGTIATTVSGVEAQSSITAEWRGTT